ncbi:1,3-propanediol dehydrogenase [Moorella humiferrea]|uniref:iron-containing alcohol dehydrogenase n=1 Tax=Neomoorella humiferrea TaxID=676965 RepID=UPI0030D39B7D
MFFSCHMPQTIVYGLGAISKVCEEVMKFLGQNILLVTDTNLSSLASVYVKEPLEQKGYKVFIYGELKREPTLFDVETGVKFFLEKKCSIIVAFGGGGVIDTAKAIAVKVTNPAHFREYPEAIKNPKIPLIAIPTTAGTGSEATAIMVITDEENNIKLNPKSPIIIPEVAIIDPQLMVSMPPHITAFTGIDALTHAIEAYVSRRANPVTDCLALHAIQLIGENLRIAFADGENLEAREAMAIASLLAGIAFSNASVCMVHAMARPLGVYFNIPHGLSNALLLPAVMEFSIMAKPDKFAAIARAMGCIPTGRSIMEEARLSIKAVLELYNDIQIPTAKELGINKEKLERVVEKMAEDALASGGVDLNPRKAKIAEVIKLYYQIYDFGANYS